MIQIPTLTLGNLILYLYIPTPENRLSGVGYTDFLMLRHVRSTNQFHINYMDWL